MTNLSIVFLLMLIITSLNGQNRSDKTSFRYYLYQRERIPIYSFIEYQIKEGMRYFCNDDRVFPFISYSIDGAFKYNLLLSFGDGRLRLF